MSEFTALELLLKVFKFLVVNLKIKYFIKQKLQQQYNNVLY